ncbi:MAG: cysteine desulfurase [Bacilli bacterium]|nr:cysteine desulfurase [Bacilli bacterium]
MIYLDNAATTKPNNLVMDSFLKIENEFFANPASIHSFGMRTNAYLEKARNVILSSLKLTNHQVVFTASSTEANNLAIKGYCLSHKNRGNKIITTNIEHASVTEVFNQLEKEFGFEVVTIDVNEDGVVTPEMLNAVMDNKTILVSIMAVNNEIGSINPIKELSKVVHSFPKAIFHSDTTQAIGKLNLDYSCIDAFVMSGHKIEGLKGSGCLVIKKGINLLPIISGGGQEDNLRSGTVSVGLAVSLAKALQLVTKDLSNKIKYIQSLKDHLVNELKKRDYLVLNTKDEYSPYIVNFSLINKKAAVVVEGLSRNDIYISSVSACHSRKEKSSYVIKALTNDESLAKNSLRVSFSESNTVEEIDIMLTKLDEIVRSIK